jgi:hypothetical protein
MKGRERLTVARSPVSRRRGSGQMVDAGEVLVVPGPRRCHDDDQLVERNSMVMTTGSIVSRGRR